MVTFLKHHWFLLFIMCVITFGAYVISLGHGFVWDDQDFIGWWESVKNLDVSVAFGGSLPEGHEGVWRPLRTILYMLSWQVYGSIPWMYHAQAIVFHIVTSILVWILLKRFVHHSAAAAVGAFVFALHPIQTESVAFVTASFDLPVSIFFIASLVMFDRYLKYRRVWYWWSSLLFGVLALLSGESALTLPLIVMLVSWYHASGKFRTTVQRSLGHWALIAVYIIVRFYILDIPVRQNAIGDTVALWILTAKGVGLYLKTILFPIMLSASHGIANEAAEIDVTTAAVLGLFAVAFIVAWRSRHQNKQVLFGVSWFVITLLPFTNIIPVGVPIAERYLYLPMVGFSFIIASLFAIAYDMIRERFHSLQKSLIVLVVCVMCIYWVRTAVRVADWKDNLTLWRTTAVTSPGSDLVHNNLGRAYAAENNMEEARKHFERAIALDPTNTTALTNAGVVYLSQGDIQEAIDVLSRSVSLEQSNKTAHITLSRAYQKQERWNDAERTLVDYLRSQPDSQVWSALGLLYANTGHVHDAEMAFRSALELDTGSIEIRNNLSAVLLSQHKTAEAIDILEKLMMDAPDDESVAENLAAAYEAIGDSNKARQVRERVSR